MSDSAKWLHGSAFGKGAAAPELLASLGAALHCAQQQAAAALGALALGGGIAALLEALHMLALGSQGRSEAACLQGAQHGLDLRCAEYSLIEGLDVADKADALGDVGRHWRLQGRAANEGDYRVQLLRGYT